MVCYDGEAYPGVVQDVDEESVQVKTMCIIGVNWFFLASERRQPVVQAWTFPGARARAKTSHQEAYDA